MGATIRLYASEKSRKAMAEAFTEITGVDPHTVLADDVEVEFHSDTTAIVRWRGFKVVSMEEAQRLIDAQKTSIGNPQNPKEK